MAIDNFIRVPKEYARVLGRMGLPEFKIVQENENDTVIQAPVEYCRTLRRMGGEYKGINDSTYLISKATSCTDETIAAKVLANQGFITNISQEGNDAAISVQYYKLQEITSSETHLTKKYLALLVHTNFDTIIGASWNGKTLTSKDVQDSIDMGGTAQDICWWVAAEDILNTKVSKTVSKPGFTTESVSVIASDSTVYNVSLTNSEFNSGNILGEGNTYPVAAGSSYAAEFHHGTEVMLTLEASEGYLITGYTINGVETTLAEAAASASVTLSSSLDADITVSVASESAGGGGSFSATIYVDSSYGDVAITDSSESVLKTISQGETVENFFNCEEGGEYKIRIQSSATTTMSGTYKGESSYNNTPVTSGSHEGYDWLDEPTSGQTSRIWTPQNGDSFTITVSGKN